MLAISVKGYEMSECHKDVAWDGDALIGWIEIDGIPTKMRN